MGNYLSKANKPSITASQCGCPLLARLVQSDIIGAICRSKQCFYRGIAVMLYTNIM